MEVGHFLGPGFVAFNDEYLVSPRDVSDDNVKIINNFFFQRGNLKAE